MFGSRAFELARAAGADGYKIHASDLGNIPLLRQIRPCEGRVFLSVGGATIREIGAALVDPAFQKRLAELGAVPMPMSPMECGKYIADETEKWAKVIKFAGMKGE